MREIIVGTICLVGAWWMSLRLSQINDWLGFGVPILLGGVLGALTQSWANGLVCLSPLECCVLIWVLGRLLDPFYWGKLRWVTKLLPLPFIISGLLGIAIGSLFHSWFAGLVLGAPAMGLLFFLYLWFQEQRAIQEMAQASQST